ncbi:putative U6 snRNA-associated Sm-like protein LSm4 [Cocos nucifera]|uniref:Putative U6 snRNA-associated Sm-like protein LSm4 n=1 Tax=Cocos nucifera TaxID=13894 RepID=A0A8K0I717_COCNU|nr:putative U6 snRNA-associated Sm-like protein LSm4 [Cocos nucifera]
MLVELKNGETYNGHLVNCDTWMNIHLHGIRLALSHVRYRISLWCRMEIGFGECLNATFEGTPLSIFEFLMRSVSIFLDMWTQHNGTRYKSAGSSTFKCFLILIFVKCHVIDKVQEETTKSRSDRKPPGVGRGRGRGREDGGSGRPAKGIGRGQEDGGKGGRGKGASGSRGAGGRGGGRGRG